MWHRAGGVPWSVLLVCVLTAGCGKSDRPWPVVPVSGTVTFRGEPVEGLIVEFQPEAGRPSQARTDQNGRFVLNYTIHEAGAQTGLHRVTFSWADQREGDRPSPAVVEIVKFHSRTGQSLNIEITKATDDLRFEFPR
ncbi:MAG: hypothetical protein KJ000_08010 [Pirellulaceae bacterium]|nr:hypothetical protein [Pirellulaceae bacterium]